MEYMLMSDGTVKAFNQLALHSDVLDALADYCGVAYYWYHESFGWSCLTSTSPQVGNAVIAEDAVPDVVKLAAMLE